MAMNAFKRLTLLGHNLPILQSKVWYKPFLVHPGCCCMVPWLAVGWFVVAPLLSKVASGLEKYAKPLRFWKVG